MARRNDRVSLDAVIVLTAAQILIGREHLWLPGVLERRSISCQKVCKATDTLRGVARFLDKWFHGRLPALNKGAAAIAAFGRALTVRDGVMMIIALVLSAVALGAGLTLLAG